MSEGIKLESPTNSPSGLPPVPLFASLAQRVANALTDTSLAGLHPRQIAIKLAEQFWREDNPTSTFSEPPSMVYEITERTVIEVQANAQAHSQKGRERGPKNTQD